MKQAIISKAKCLLKIHRSLTQSTQSKHITNNSNQFSPFNIKYAYNFAAGPVNKKAIQKTRQSLLKQVEKQIKQEQLNTYDVNRLENQLKNIGWTTTKIQSKLEFEKQTQKHNFLGLVTIKPPVMLNTSQKESLILARINQIKSLEEQIKKRNDSKKKKKIEQIKLAVQNKIYDEGMCQITMFVHKKGRPKYACIQYLANSQYIQINEISFLNQIVKLRIDRMRNCTQNSGRDIEILNYKILDLLRIQMEEEWNIRKQVLKTIFTLAMSYQQKQYLNWLKSFRQMV